MAGNQERRCFVATKHCKIAHPTDLIAYTTLAYLKFGLSYSEWSARSAIKQPTLTKIIKRLQALDLIDKTASDVWTARPPADGWFVPHRCKWSTAWFHRTLYFAVQEKGSFTLTQRVIISRLWNLVTNDRWFATVSGIAANCRVSARTVIRAVEQLNQQPAWCEATIKHGERGKRQQASIIIWKIGIKRNPNQPQTASEPAIVPPTNNAVPLIFEPPTTTASEPAIVPPTATPPRPSREPDPPDLDKWLNNESNRRDPRYNLLLEKWLNETT